MPETWGALVTVGRIARPHGLRGHVLIDVETDFPEARFRPGRDVQILREGRVETFRIVQVRFHQGRPLVGFAGLDTVAAAQALAGSELRVPAADLEPLPGGTYYRHDLVGCEVVTVAGEAVGRVVAVEGPRESSRLVVAGPRGETLVPLAAGICVAVDPAARRIRIAPPEGLLDLNVRPSRRDEA